MNGSAYVINLDHRTERMREFLSKFSFIDVERFSAINGMHLYDSNDFSDDDVNFVFSNLIDRLKILPGVLGCWVSHVKLWRKLADSSDDFYLIFEDDAFFVDGYEEKLNSVLNYINRDVDLFYLGGRPIKNFAPKSMISNWDEIEVDDNFSVYSQVNFDFGPDFSRTTHAYIVTRWGAKKLLTLFEESSSLVAIDDWLTEIRPKINCFEIFPHLCWSPFDYQTDIQKVVAKRKLH